MQNYQQTQLSAWRLGFLAKNLAINLAKKSKKNQDLGKKFKVMPVESEKK